MKSTPDYELATNTAYRLLVASGRVEPCADILQLAACCREAAVVSYREMAERFALSGEQFAAMLSSEYGLTIRKGKQALILYNQEKDPRTVRFTIAHELGHVVLHHREDTRATDREANCFARNLLCPLPVARGLHLTSPEDYASTFGVSLPMASASWENRHSDAHYLDRGLERQVEELFALFLLEQAGRREAAPGPDRMPLAFSRTGREIAMEPLRRSERDQEEWERRFRLAEQKWLYGES